MEHNLDEVQLADTSRDVSKAFGCKDRPSFLDSIEPGCVVANDLLAGRRPTLAHQFAQPLLVVSAMAEVRENSPIP